MTQVALCACVAIVAIFGAIVLSPWTWLRRLTLAVMAIRVLIGVGNHFYGVFVTPDALTYQAQAMALFTGSQTHLLSAGKEGWPLFLALLFRVGGPSAFYSVLVNAVLCALVIPLVARTARAVLPGTERVAATMVLLTPAWWVWGITGLREPSIWFVALFGLLGLSEHAASPKPSGLLMALLSFVTMVWLRPGIAVVIAVVACIILLFVQKSIGSFFVAVSGGVVAFLLSQETLSSVTMFDTTVIQQSRNSLLTAGSGFGDSSLLASTLRVLTGPWPWEIPALGLVALPEAISLYVILLLTLLGLRSVRILRTAGLYMAAGVAIQLILTSGNYGTMIRIRTICLLALVPVAAAGYQRLRQGSPKRTVEGARRERIERHQRRSTHLSRHAPGS